jgi:hypothetical protein
MRIPFPAFIPPLAFAPVGVCLSTGIRAGSTEVEGLALLVGVSHVGNCTTEVQAAREKHKRIRASLVLTVPLFIRIPRQIL